MMECRDCEKKLMGGFKQDDGKFLCADCVIEAVEKTSRESIKNKTLQIVDRMLLPKNRPTKRQLKELRSWLKALT